MRRLLPARLATAMLLVHLLTRSPDTLAPGTHATPPPPILTDPVRPVRRLRPCTTRTAAHLLYHVHHTLIAPYTLPADTYAPCRRSSKPSSYRTWQPASPTAPAATATAAAAPAEAAAPAAAPPAPLTPLQLDECWFRYYCSRMAARWNVRCGHTGFGGWGGAERPARLGPRGSLRGTAWWPPAPGACLQG